MLVRISYFNKKKNYMLLDHHKIAIKMKNRRRLHKHKLKWNNEVNAFNSQLNQSHLLECKYLLKM